MSDQRTGEPSAKPPVPAVVLGAAGLIPFLLLTGMLFVDGDFAHRTARPALLGYSIAILSFMGAVHWGLAMGDQSPDGGQVWRRYIVSVLPALAASATVFIQAELQFVWLGFCFFALLVYDLFAVSCSEAPRWYSRLRWPLTLIVCVCLGAVALQESQNMK